MDAPQAITNGWNKGNKEPWKTGSVVLQGDQAQGPSAQTCVPMELNLPTDPELDVSVSFDMTEELLPPDAPEEYLSHFKLAAQVCSPCLMNTHSAVIQPNDETGELGN